MFYKYNFRKSRRLRHLTLLLRESIIDYIESILPNSNAMRFEVLEETILSVRLYVNMYL